MGFGCPHGVNGFHQKPNDVELPLNVLFGKQFLAKPYITRFFFRLPLSILDIIHIGVPEGKKKEKKKKKGGETTKGAASRNARTSHAW